MTRIIRVTIDYEVGDTNPTPLTAYKHLSDSVRELANYGTYVLLPQRSPNVGLVKATGGFVHRHPVDGRHCLTCRVMAAQDHPISSWPDPSKPRMRPRSVRPTPTE